MWSCVIVSPSPARTYPRSSFGSEYIAHLSLVWCCGSLEFKEKCSLIRKGEWITQAFHEPIELEPGMF
jgi:hypothetical protein